MVLTIEDMEISELKERLAEIVTSATQKSQNELKLEVLSKLGLQDYQEGLENSLSKYAIVFKDGDIQVWTGTEFKDFKSFYEELVKVKE